MKYKMILLVLVTTCLLLTGAEDVPRPSYARTILKVARSLPGETEELKVRTSGGSVATLIVKRREKSDQQALDNKNQQLQNNTEKNYIKISEQSQNSNNPEVNIEKSQNFVKFESERRGDTAEKHEENRKNAETFEKNNEAKFEKEPTFIRLNTQTSEPADFASWRPVNVNDFDSRSFQSATTESYHSWKPLPSTQSTNDDRTNYGLIFARNFQERNERNLEQNDNRRRYTILPHTSRPLTRTNIGANLSKNRGGKNVPPEVTVRSEINVNNFQKRTPMSIDADGTPVIHGKRVPDEPIDKIQTWRNARVINNKLVSEGTSPEELESDNGYGDGAERRRFERFFQDVNRSTQQALTPELWLRRYGRNFDQENVYYEWDPHRSLSLNADVYETGNENYRSNIHKRMLHPESTHNYPVSQMYTPESQKISPLTLKPGARAPVLQYAHPELGVQPAKILKSEKKKPDNFPENQHSFTEQRHKKKYVLNDKNVIDSYSTKNYYPNQHFYGLKTPQEQPFWVKISENLKNQLSTGVERVSQLTKPVFEPLVEATQKISQNLGLSRGHDQAQDKIGAVATGSSMLIPALGLVASGAALGIGAVAVGRYLDVDVMKRSKDSRSFGSNPEQLRALEASRAFADQNAGSDGLVPIVIEEPENTENRQIDPFFTQKSADFQQRSASNQRRRRSLDELNLFDLPQEEDDTRSRRMRRTGADSLADIIEIDVPASKDDILFLIDDTNSVSEGARRTRRNAQDQEIEDALQNLENAEITDAAHIEGDWTNTPCAKRIFCDAMVKRGSDASIMMEKRMDSLLRLIQPGAAAQVSSHFHEVMEAVRRHDCSSFMCPQARPANVFF